MVDGNRYSEDDLLAAIGAGALDVSTDDDVFEVLTGPGDLTAVRAALEEAGIELESAEVVRHPKTRVPVEEEVAGQLLRLIDALEDNDDVGEVHGNFDVDARRSSSRWRADRRASRAEQRLVPRALATGAGMGGRVQPQLPAALRAAQPFGCCSPGRRCPPSATG